MEIKVHISRQCKKY